MFTSKVRAAAVDTSRGLMGLVHNDGTVAVFTTFTGSIVWAENPGTGRGTCVDVAHIGGYMLTGDSNGWVRCWDIEKGVVKWLACHDANQTTPDLATLRSRHQLKVHMPETEQNPDTAPDIVQVRIERKGGLAFSRDKQGKVAAWSIWDGEPVFSSEALRIDDAGESITPTVEDFIIEDSNMLNVAAPTFMRLDPLRSVLLCTRSDGSIVARWTHDMSVAWFRAKGEAHADYVRCVDLDVGRGMFVTGGGDGKVKCWATRTGHVVWSGDVHKNDVTSVAIDKEGATVLSGSLACTIACFDLNSGNVLWMKHYEHPNPPTAEIRMRVKDLHRIAPFAKAPDKAHLLGEDRVSYGKEMSAQPLKKFRGKYTKDPRTYHSHANSLREYLLEDRTAGILAMGDVAPAASGMAPSPHAHKSPVLCVGVDGIRGVGLSGSADQSVRGWDLETGHFLWQSGNHHAAVTSITVDEQLGIGISVAANVLRGWETETGVQLWAFASENPEAIHTVVIDSMRQLVMSVAGGEVRKWVLMDGTHDFIDSPPVFFAPPLSSLSKSSPPSPIIDISIAPSGEMWVLTAAHFVAVDVPTFLIFDAYPTQMGAHACMQLLTSSMAREINSIATELQYCADEDDDDEEGGSAEGQRQTTSGGQGPTVDTGLDAGLPSAQGISGLQLTEQRRHSQMSTMSSVASEAIAAALDPEMEALQRRLALARKQRRERLIKRQTKLLRTQSKRADKILPPGEEQRNLRDGHIVPVPGAPERQLVIPAKQMCAPGTPMRPPAVVLASSDYINGATTLTDDLGIQTRWLDNGVGTRRWGWRGGKKLLNMLTVTWRELDTQSTMARYIRYLLFSGTAAISVYNYTALTPANKRARKLGLHTNTLLKWTPTYPGLPYSADVLGKYLRKAEKKRGRRHSLANAPPTAPVRSTRGYSAASKMALPSAVGSAGESSHAYGNGSFDDLQQQHGRALVPLGHTESQSMSARGSSRELLHPAEARFDDDDASSRIGSAVSVQRGSGGRAGSVGSSMYLLEMGLAAEADGEGRKTATAEVAAREDGLPKVVFLADQCGEMVSMQVQPMRRVWPVIRTHHSGNEVTEFDRKQARRERWQNMCVSVFWMVLFPLQLLYIAFPPDSYRISPQRGAAVEVPSVYEPVNDFMMTMRYFDLPIADQAIDASISYSAALFGSLALLLGLTGLTIVMDRWRRRSFLEPWQDRWKHRMTALSVLFATCMALLPYPMINLFTETLRCDYYDNPGTRTQEVPADPDNGFPVPRRVVIPNNWTLSWQIDKTVPCYGGSHITLLLFALWGLSMTLVLLWRYLGTGMQLQNMHPPKLLYSNHWAFQLFAMTFPLPCCICRCSRDHLPQYDRGSRFYGTHPFRIVNASHYRHMVVLHAITEVSTVILYPWSSAITLITMFLGLSVIFSSHRRVSHWHRTVQRCRLALDYFAGGVLIGAFFATLWLTGDAVRVANDFLPWSLGQLNLIDSTEEELWAVSESQRDLLDTVALYIIPGMAVLLLIFGFFQAVRCDRCLGRCCCKACNWAASRRYHRPICMTERKAVNAEHSLSNPLEDDGDDAEALAQKAGVGAAAALGTAATVQKQAQSKLKSGRENKDRARMLQEGQSGDRALTGKAAVMVAPECRPGTAATNLAADAVFGHGHWTSSDIAKVVKSTGKVAGGRKVVRNGAIKPWEQELATKGGALINEADDHDFDA